MPRLVRPTLMRALLDNGYRSGWAALHRRVLAQRAMSSRRIIIGGICAEDPAQVRFTEHDHMVETFPAIEPMSLST
jgi:hypothetical protein